MMEMDVGVVPRTAGNIRSEERGPEQSPSELTKEPTCQHIHLRLLEPFRAFRINDPNMFFLNPQIKKKKCFSFPFQCIWKTETVMLFLQVGSPDAYNNLGWTSNPEHNAGLLHRERGPKYLNHHLRMTRELDRAWLEPGIASRTIACGCGHPGR